MKNILSFIFVLALFSCNTGKEDNFNATESTIKTEENTTNTINADLEDFNFKLSQLSYVTGRIIINSEEVRHYIENFNNERIEFNELFENETFNAQFQDIVNCELNTEYGCFTGRPGRVGVRPPIGCCNQQQQTNTQNNENRAEGYNSWAELKEFFTENCFELYLAKKIELTGTLYEHLYITNHPLRNGRFLEEFYGFDLFLNEQVITETPYWSRTIVDGQYVPFDENLFVNQEFNILVLRPIRTKNCAYDNIEVDDFTKFYSM